MSLILSQVEKKIQQEIKDKILRTIDSKRTVYLNIHSFSQFNHKNILRKLILLYIVHPDCLSTFIMSFHLDEFFQTFLFTEVVIPPRQPLS